MFDIARSTSYRAIHPAAQTTTNSPTSTAVTPSEPDLALALSTTSRRAANSGHEGRESDGGDR